MGLPSFREIAAKTAEWVGTPLAFGLATGFTVLWAVTGPLFRYSDTWQLVINTATTVLTFLIVFLIQNTQNRDAKATQLKLDELIRAVGGARNALVDLEHVSEAELDALEKEFGEVRMAALHERRRRDELTRRVTRDRRRLRGRLKKRPAELGE